MAAAKGTAALLAVFLVQVEVRTFCRGLVLESQQLATAIVLVFQRDALDILNKGARFEAVPIEGPGASVVETVITIRTVRALWNRWRMGGRGRGNSFDFYFPVFTCLSVSPFRIINVSSHSGLEETVTFCCRLFLA